MQRTAPIGSDENHLIPPGEMRLDGFFFSGSAPVAAGQEVRRPRRGPACGVPEGLGSKVTVLFFGGSSMRLGLSLLIVFP